MNGAIKEVEKRWPPFTIKKLQQNQIKEVIKLHNKHLGKRDFINEEELKKRIKTNRGIFLIAEDNKTHKIIGIKFGYFDGKECTGRGIVVLPKWRRRGVGKVLVEEFEKQLKANQKIKKYVFGSATETGIPFHIYMGYNPVALMQFKDKNLRNKLNLSGFKILKEKYNKDYKIYQIHIKLKKSSQNLNNLKMLIKKFPKINVQYVFSKSTAKL